MDYKTLNEYIQVYHLEKYISLLKCYTMYDKEYSMFYIAKNKMLWRVINGFSNKYIVFQNCDLEYGKHKNERLFSNIDDASNYLWKLFVEYAHANNNEHLIKIIETYIE